MKTKERVKTILLVVLFIGATFLTYLNWTNYTNSTERGGGVTLAIPTAGSQGMETVAPFAISYKTERGRFGAAYHGGSVNTVFLQSASLIYSALSQTEGFSQTTKAQWDKTLESEGLLVDFEGNVPVYMIANMVEVEVESDICARYMSITPDGIFFKNSVNGRYYKGEHQLDKGDFAVLDGLNASACATAYEAGSTRVSGETLVFDGNISAFVINAVNPAESFNDVQYASILKIFQMNYNTCGKHTETDGTKVFVEDLNTIRISPDGFLTYESKGVNSETSLNIVSDSEVPTLREVQEGSDKLINSLMSFVGTDAPVYLRHVSGDKVQYGRSFGGIPVDHSKAGNSAEVHYEGSRVVYLSFNLRNYQSSSNAMTVLPQKLAIATVPGKTFGTVSLRYNDSGLGGAEAQWYVKKD